MNSETKTLFTIKQFEEAYNDAVEMLQDNDGLEITSALKQCASDVGIEEGAPLRAFVLIAEEKMGVA